MNTIVYGSNVVDSIGTLVASGTWSFNGATLTITNGSFSGSVPQGASPVVITGSGVTILNP